MECLLLSHSGYCAFTHKAGIHAKAILNNPATYEILKPEDFGLKRYVSIGCVSFFCLGRPISPPLMIMLMNVDIGSRNCTDLRCVTCSHRLTGWNAVKSRVEQLGLQMTDNQIKDATAKIKELADVRTQSMEDVDTVLRVYHSGVVSGELELGDKQTFDRLLQRHREVSNASATEESPSSIQPTSVAV
jgi:homocitrate synthase